MARKKLTTKQYLTPAQERFVIEYLIDPNGTQAYRRAYPKAKPGTARTNAARMLANAHVRAEIRRRRRRLNDRLELTAERVVRELIRLAFSDLGDVIDLTDPTRPRLKKYADIPPDARKAIQEVTRTKFGVKVKLADKLSAIDRLMRHMGLYQDIPALDELMRSLPPDLGAVVRQAVADHLRPQFQPSAELAPPPTADPPALPAAPADDVTDDLFDDTPGGGP